MTNNNDMFGIESYQQTRRPALGRACPRQQLDMFALAVPVPVKPLTVRPKRGQRYRVSLTGMVVTYIRAVGTASLWECDGIIWRATRAQIEAAGLQYLS